MKIFHKIKQGHLRRNELHCSFHGSFVDLKLKIIRKRLRNSVSDRFETHTAVIFKSLCIITESEYKKKH